MGTMKLIVEQTFASQVINKINKTITITPFNRGQRQMLEAVSSRTLTATATVVLTDASAVIQVIDPGGASRDVTLPAESIDNHGFLIMNTADVLTELLVVKNDGGTEIGTVYPGGAGWFISNNADWRSAGLGTTSIATKRIVHWRVHSSLDTLTTGDGKDYFAVPSDLNGYNLVDADAVVDTVSSSGTPIFQLRNVTDAVDMLSTRITIDANEFPSYTAAAAPVIDTTKDDVATGDRIAVDIDGIGTGTKGLIIIMVFQLP